jgi:2,3-bisphosphoglycerate-independent phosphoglycerate mutase
MSPGSIKDHSQKRCVVLILDGLGDRPVASLGGLTPLEAALTPNLDRMASRGRFGLVDPVAAGVVPNTHSGVGFMLGLKPEQREQLKRGPIEAAGAGLTLRRGDVAMRANLATVEDRAGRLFITDRRAGRVTADAAAFAPVLADIDLGDRVHAGFLPTDQHRGVLVFRGPGLDANLGDTDPGDAGAPGWLKPCDALSPGASFAAGKVDDFHRVAHERLREHPLNRQRLRQGKPPVSGVIARGAGEVIEPGSVLRDRRISAALVAGCNTVIGLGRVLGLETISQAGFTADAGTDIGGKLVAARAALERFPLVYVHIKAPDLFSHDFQPAGKRDFLQRIDRTLVKFDGCGAALAVTSDHTTDSNTGAHAADPVPALFYDPDAPAGGSARTVKFGETACRDGSMPRLSGPEFLTDIVAYLSS